MKIAVIGTGGVAGKNYLPYIAAREDVQLSYLNRTRSKAEAVAERFGGRVAADAADLMADEPDACLVFTREMDRLDAANTLLPLKPKRLFFEKPLAARHGQANVEEEDFFDAREMLEAAHGAGVETAMVFNYRFFDQTRLAREIVAREAFGTPVHFSGHGTLRLLEPLHRPGALFHGAGGQHQRASDRSVRPVHGRRGFAQRNGGGAHGERRHGHADRHVRDRFQAAALRVDLCV